jgi:hypothetical protein
VFDNAVRFRPACIAVAESSAAGEILSYPPLARSCC